MFAVSHTKGAVIKLPKDTTPIDFASLFIQKIGDTADDFITDKQNSFTILTKKWRHDFYNNLKKVSTSSLHFVVFNKTGKTRTSIKRGRVGFLNKNEKLEKVL